MWDEVEGRGERKKGVFRRRRYRENRGDKGNVSVNESLKSWKGNLLSGIKKTEENVRKGLFRKREESIEKKKKEM